FSYLVYLFNFFSCQNSVYNLIEKRFQSERHDRMCLKLLTMINVLTMDMMSKID
ncbi:hypothetical protein Goshw_014163, partial [Gossypium schwendimanii]|nr:hypothetical protein [Gossypium schwendimanii]